MQEIIKDSNGNDVSFVTQITLENGKVYTLYTDGKLYEEIEGKGFVELDCLNEENKKIISKIMERLKPERTDVIGTKKYQTNKKIIQVEAPEL